MEQKFKIIPLEERIVLDAAAVITMFHPITIPEAVSSLPSNSHANVNHSTSVLNSSNSTTASPAPPPTFNPSETIYVNVNAANSQNLGTKQDPFTSLQVALQSVSASQSGTIIDVASGDYQLTSPTDSFVLPNNVELFGGYNADFTTRTMNTTFLDGAGIAPSIVTANGVSALIDGFTLESNNISIFANGGGISANGSSLILSHDTFGNLSDPSRGLSVIASGGVGGAVYAVNSDVYLSYDTFSHDRGNFGGAVFLGYGSTPSTLEIDHSVFIDNSAGGGGAIYSDLNNILQIDHATFTGNSSTTGGAIFSSGDSSSISDAAFSNNSAFLGGAILSYEDTSSISHATFTNNHVYGQGGAIFSEADPLLQIDHASFINNQANASNPFVQPAGGAINAVYGSSVLIDYSNFIDNSTTSNAATGNGGAVNTVHNGSVQYLHDNFFGNSANTQTGNAIGAGGAISSEGENLTIVGSAFVDNSSSHLGGAISSIANGTNIITQDTFIGNTVINNSTLNIPSGAVGVSLGNTQNEGGAIYLAASNPIVGLGFTAFGSTISQDTFIGNAVTSSNGDGGAIVISSDVNVIFSKNTLISNEATFGGAVFITGSQASMTQNTFTSNGIDDNNVLSEYGGAIYAAQSDITMSQASFARNAAVRGGAIYISYGNTMNIEKTTFTKNQAALGGALYVDLNNDNLTIGSSTEFSGNSINNPYVSQINNENAGSNIYVALAATLDGSISAGTGINGQTSAVGIVSVLSSNDIPASTISVPLSPTVLNATDSASLQSDLNEALYLGLTEIKLAAGSFTPPSGASFNLPSDLLLQGTNPTNTSTSTQLVGNGTTVVTALEGTVVVDSVAITGGNSDNNSSFLTAGCGGGIYAYTEYLVVNNANIYNNQANEFGGAIFSLGQEDGVSGVGSTVIINSNISENNASNGALFSYDQNSLNISGSDLNNNHGGAVFSELDNTVAISDSNLSNNIVNGGTNFSINVSGANGGALFSELDNTVSVSNSNFTNNTASADGGAIYSTEVNSVNITNSNFNGNNAAYEGGAVEVFGVNAASITNTGFVDNSLGPNGGYNGDGGSALDMKYDGAVTITGNFFSGNTGPANWGAAINLDTNASVNSETAMLDIVNSLINSNTGLTADDILLID